MFDGASNVQLGGELIKLHDPKLTVMHGFEQTVYLFFNNVPKIPIMNHMNHMITEKLFGSGICHKPHYIFKSKFYEFHNRKIGLFSGNDNHRWLFYWN